MSDNEQRYEQSLSEVAADIYSAMARRYVREWSESRASIDINPPRRLQAAQFREMDAFWRTLSHPPRREKE